MKMNQAYERIMQGLVEVAHLMGIEDPEGLRRRIEKECGVISESLEEDKPDLSVAESFNDLKDFNEEENTLCGYDISQPLILSKDEFLSFMDDVIEESNIK